MHVVIFLICFNFLIVNHQPLFYLTCEKKERFIRLTTIFVIFFVLFKKIFRIVNLVQKLLLVHNILI